jgi:hypothetical protein
MALIRGAAMTITIADLDGKYEVKSKNANGDPYTVDGDGTTEIRNGLTFRKDKNGLIWESAFTVLNDRQVKMESTVDPSHASNTVYLRDDKGNPTSAMLTFRTILEATHVDGRLTLSGVVEHGPEKTYLTLTKI